MQFDFATSGRILFGMGVLKDAVPLAAEMGQCACLVTGQGGANPERITELLTRAGMNWESAEVAGEPSLDSVRQAVEAARAAGCDCVIAYGGGSVIDTGKAVASMLANPGGLTRYLEVVGENQPIPHPSLPMMAVPTTAGTGSEVTRNAVLYVPEKRVKVSMRSPFLLPKIAVIDPELTFSLPPAATASTGMDALTQVLEPYVCKRANAMTDLFCREGLARAGRSLLKAYQNGQDAQAREDMSWASLLGGLSLANAGLGAVHGFAGPIGGMFDAPHGAVCAALLPAVTRVNVRALQQRDPDSPALGRYREIAQFLLSDGKAEIADGVRFLDDLRSALSIPGLGRYGVKPEDFEEIAQKAAKASSMKPNPVELTHDELLEILESAL